MPQAANLRHRVAFESQSSANDDYGIVATSWSKQFSCRAGMKYLKGAEPVIAQRLTGISPVVITVRSSHLTRAVDASWRIRDENLGTVFDIKSATPDETRTWIDYLCETGALS